MLLKRESVVHDPLQDGLPNCRPCQFDGIIEDEVRRAWPLTCFCFSYLFNDGKCIWCFPS